MFTDFFKNVIYKNLFDYFSLLFHKFLKKAKKIRFQGKEYKYMVKKYNYSWRNERTIEVSIVKDLIDQNKNAKILEVGNVLSHYYPVDHDIIDKYERGENVINEDIQTYTPTKKYDLIIAISTFEHIGHDEKPKENDKMLKVVPNLNRLLNDKGKVVFTHPIGYNSTLDKLFFGNKIKLSKKLFLNRISKLNYWKESSFEEVKNYKYNKPFNNANAIMFGVIEK